SLVYPSEGWVMARFHDPVNRQVADVVALVGCYPALDPLHGRRQVDRIDRDPQNLVAKGTHRDPHASRSARSDGANMWSLICRRRNTQSFMLGRRRAPPCEPECPRIPLGHGRQVLLVRFARGAVGFGLAV